MIRLADKCVHILCTKRPENFPERFDAVLKHNENNHGAVELHHWVLSWASGEYPPNIILLTSVENQAMADKRIPQLLKIPAACRGLLCEPLLGPIDFRLTPCTPNISEEEAQRMTEYQSCLEEIDWVIIGGESGPKARPCNVGWVRSLVEQGRAAGVATFVKQFSGKKFGQQFPKGF